MCLYKIMNLKLLKWAIKIKRFDNCLKKHKIFKKDKMSIFLRLLSFFNVHV